MDRIIPFGYPTIVGGASGGASVDPTPPSSDDPQPGPATLPYDLENVSFRSKGLVENTETVANVHVAKTTTATVQLMQYAIVEGIVPVDLTGVRQIKLSCPNKSDDSFIFTADGTDIKDKLGEFHSIDITKGILEFQDGDMFTGNQLYYITKDNWNPLSGKQIVFKCPLTIKVYDTAGEIMQEYETELTI